jgi:putative redox protein
MVEVKIDYEGTLRCRATHGPSGDTLITDAPVDNMGQGKAFSPTDLVGTALGSCMLTIMGIAARSMDIEIKGASATVLKEMVKTPQRRISKLAVTIHVPGKFTDEQKQKLHNAALTCPVHRSLHPDVQLPIEFRWDV